MDKSVSKITRKFVVKFIIWFLIFTVISTLGVVFMFANSLENVEEDVSEIVGVLNGLIIGLAVADFIVAFLTTKLSLRGATRKIEITNDNKKNVVKNISIVLCVFAILVCLLHTGIKVTLYNIVSEEANTDIEELAEEVEDLDEKYDLTDDEIEEVEAFVGFMKMANIYVFDGLFMLIMIPVAKKSIEKKVA